VKTTWIALAIASLVVVRTADAAEPSASSTPTPTSTSTSTSTSITPEPNRDPTQGLALTAYVQTQYESHQDSEDQLRQGGALLNKDRFLVRRGRVKVEREWDWASLMVEVDGNTTNGPVFQLWHAEPSLLYRGKNDPKSPPMVKATMGMFDTPFGWELVESPRTRYFMERSTISRALWPSEPDIGARVSGALGWFRYAFAFVNGQPAGVKDFALQDPNGSKDFVARVGGVVDVPDRVEFQFGVSFLDGKGFHKGTDATKSGVVWKDANENGIIDLGELQPVVGQAATPSQNFDRWAVGADARLRFKTRLGWSMLFGELVFASNLDRGLVIADPVLTGIDSREVGYVAGFVQEIGDHFVVGLRHDFYDPNADYLDREAGKLVPQSQRIRNWSPMIGAVLPGRARLLFQYDAQRNYFARNEQGVPINLAANTWTLRLQVEL
jgi:hypothetical protein